MDEESKHNAALDNSPDRLQQALNRLRKRFEDLSFEQRRVCAIYEVKRMAIPKRDRDEMLRRLG